MSTAAKLAISVATILLLIFGVELAVVALMSGAGLLQVAKGIWLNFYLNNSFNGFLGFVFLSSFVVFPVFDCLSIMCFRYGWDNVDREMDISLEDSTGPKISTRQKVAVMYPFLVISILLVIGVLAARQKDTILELGL
jgi:hypothetical protein